MVAWVSSNQASNNCASEAAWAIFKHTAYIWWYPGDKKRSSGLTFYPLKIISLTKGYYSDVLPSKLTARLLPTPNTNYKITGVETNLRLSQQCQRCWSPLLAKLEVIFCSSTMQFPCANSSRRKGKKVANGYNCKSLYISMLAPLLQPALWPWKVLSYSEHILTFVQQYKGMTVSDISTSGLGLERFKMQRMSFRIENR